MRRFISFIAILFVAYYVPNIVLPLIVLGAVFFPFFFEGALVAFFIDRWYGFGSDSFLISFRYTVISIALILVIEFLRKRVRSFHE